MHYNFATAQAGADIEKGQLVIFNEAGQLVPSSMQDSCCLEFGPMREGVPAGSMVDLRYFIRVPSNIERPRPPRHYTFMEMARAVAKRSPCWRAQHGAVAVRDNHVLATGYNGPPSGTPHCTIDSCTRWGKPTRELYAGCPAVHAEQNVIIQASLNRVSLAGATVYCTAMPCEWCARMLVNSGIAEFVAHETFVDLVQEELILGIMHPGIRVIYLPHELEA